MRIPTRATRAGCAPFAPCRFTSSVVRRTFGPSIQESRATIYLAHDRKHDRKVAVKVLRPELAAVLGAERFLGEVWGTANLQHPNLLPLVDSGEAGGYPEAGASRDGGR